MKRINIEELKEIISGLVADEDVTSLEELYDGVETDTEEKLISDALLELGA